jgi:glutathione S-transferase
MPGRRVGLIPNFLYCPHPRGLIYLDDVVGPSRVLLPVAGEPRRRCLRILASATAACEKAIAISYERRRPSEKIFVDWIARCRTQLSPGERV